MENHTTTDPGVAQRYRVCAVEEIAENGGVLADLGHREVGVFKHKGRLYAYDNRCIHQGGPVCSGELLGATKLELDEGKQARREILDEDEMRLVCPWHGWEFDLLSGQAAHDRRYRLRRFNVTVEDGVVYVDA
ncbi:MAG: Rieske (2Fe-2S) protein [Solirubrobacterales bacterium]|nr:Rieske (2Fe-2S) protein [Solirubrobacterales bacterium]MBV9717062.1 Rieske (2Fe-2S) protein [Solirubrobacterales bacterium]